MKKRYETIQTGLRKDLKLGGYLAEKMVNRVRCSGQFSRLRDAQVWLKTHCPNEKQLNNVHESIITFEDVWKAYQKDWFRCLSTSSKRNKKDKERFFSGLFKYKMSEINSRVISDHIESEKNKSIINPRSKRCNFNDDLKALNAIFNWYRQESEDTPFINPISEKHKKIGFIKNTMLKEKKMTREDLLHFWKSLGNKTIWQDLNRCQVFLAARIQEICGIQLQNIDLVGRKLLIKDVIIWGRDKKFLELKSLPKNGECRQLSLNDSLFEIVQRRVEIAKRDGSMFLFHIDGIPLSYRQVQYQYNRGLKMAGLYPRFSSTHFSRHTGGTIARLATGSLDSAQAVGGWKDRDIAQHYCRLDSSIQGDAVKKMEEYLNE